MKKFSLLAIGEAFEYQGKHYTKSGPLTASRSNGNNRMIPRSAVVAPLTGAAPERIVEAIEEKPLPAGQVIEAFEHYHKGCVEWLAMTEKVDAALAATIREAMESAKARFLNELQQLQD